MVAFSKKLCSLVLVLIGLIATPASAGTHKDEMIGFEITIPSRWEVIPLQANEAWFRAKYKADKEDRYRDKERGSTYTHAPRLTVIVFLDAILDAETEVSSEDGEMKVTWESPFEDYLDFLAKTNPGFYVESDEETEQNGLPVRCLEIQRSGLGPPMHVVTWIYTTQLGKVAVEVEAFEDAWKKRRKDAYKIVKSLKAIEITKELDLVDKFQSRFSSMFSYTVSAEEREIRRKEQELEAWREANENLVDGWTAKMIDDVPILTVDMGYAKKVAERVVGVREWLNENFSIIGEGEYVRMPLVRVFEDGRSEADFQQGLGSQSNEITTNKQGRIDVTSYTVGRSVIFANELGYVNYQTMRQWFNDRDRDVYWNMPPWLLWGLSQLIAQADTKGRGLDFRSGLAERYFTREIDEDDLPTVRELMRMSDAQFNEDQAAGLGYSLALVRYFVDGPGSKDKDTRDVLPNYLRNLTDLVREAREKEFEGADKEPENEEEEAELERRRREWFQQQRRHVIDESFNRTFADWDEDRWRGVEKGFQRSF